jgi:hypothetical protein
MSEFDRLTELTATPIIITSEMDESELEYEFLLMMTRSEAAAALINGEIRIDDYLDTLAECEIDVDDALDCWASGYSLMGN